MLMFQLVPSSLVQSLGKSGGCCPVHKLLDIGECTGREAEVGAASRHVQVDGAGAVCVVQDLAEVLHHLGDGFVCNGVAYPGQPPRAAAGAATASEYSAVRAGANKTPCHISVLRWLSMCNDMVTHPALSGTNKNLSEGMACSSASPRV